MAYGVAMRVLTTAEIRSDKPDRVAFRAADRLPVRVVLDGVQRAYNLGAIFRLCDAMLVERLIVCGGPVRRRLVPRSRAIRPTIYW